MIVTSMKCYLNILTQLCDKDTLLRANYYICDIRSPDALSQVNDSYKYNEDGQLVPVNDISYIPTKGMNQYNITYGTGELDPSPYITNTLLGISQYDDPVNRFIAHLNSSEIKGQTYNMLMRKHLRGNGLQILIFANEDIIKEYVHIVCEYLSYNFGFDIIFIDPQYRPDVLGKSEYHGDKVFAQQNIKNIQDMQLVLEFNQAITQCGGAESIGNLTTYLNAFNAQQLVYLYNLIFVNAPLPPDNYSAEHIKQIIIGKVVSDMPKQSILPNLYSSNELMNLINDYDDSDDDMY